MNDSNQEYRIKLQELSQQPLPEGTTQRESEHRLIARWRAFVPDKPLGRQVYESYSDEELIAVLKAAYERLGRAPVQSDIFCFYRTYIKHRFGTWTAALKAAGLNYNLNNRDNPFSAKSIERIKEEEPETYVMLIRLSERRKELGYPPNRKEVPENKILKERFKTWNQAINAAECLDAWQQSQPDDRFIQLSVREEMLLQEIKENAELLCRTPLETEINEEVRWRLRVRCGSWDSVIRRAGLEPLSGDALKYAEWDQRQRRLAGEGELYIIPNLEPEYTLLLKELRVLAAELGRAPLKEEIASEKRQRLQERCGSWRNVLYQIGIEAFSRDKASKIKIKKRRSKKRRSKI